MNRLVTISFCVLGLIIICAPAYASPKNKKITLSCSSSDPGETVTGDVTVTLCATLATCGDPAQSVPCPKIFCDSSGHTAALSSTWSCSAPFKVGGVTAQINLEDSEGKTGGSSPSIAPVSAKGFSITVAPQSDQDTDSDNETVVLTVK
jgi:hypothetical protein